MFVLSDFHESGAVDALKLMAQVHDVVALSRPIRGGDRGGGLWRAAESSRAGPSSPTVAACTSTPRPRGERCAAAASTPLIRTDEPFAQNLRMFLKDRAVLAGGR